MINKLIDELIDGPIDESIDGPIGEPKSKVIGKITDSLPPELKPFKEAVVAALNGDMFEAIIKVALKLLPLIGIALAAIIVGFIIKWWVGLLAIPCAIIWLIYRILLIVNGIRKFISALPASVVKTLGDLADIL